MSAFSSLCALATTLAAAMPPQTTGHLQSETQAVIRANNQFAVNLYRELSKRDGNLFFSPYSINKTLSMTYAGARGDTAREMAATLCSTLPQERHHRAFLEARGAINRSLQSRSSRFFKKNGVELLQSAALWGQRGTNYEREFQSLLQECYDAPLQEINFADSERARDTINRWAATQTKNRIPELLPPAAVSAATRLILASAIYFKGDWMHPFLKNKTSDDDFHVSGGGIRKTPMMRQQETFGYFENDEMQALSLPYEGNSLAMLVLLPRKVDGLTSLEKVLSAEKLADWAGQARAQPVNVVLPKFKLTDDFELARALEQLGMRLAFDQLKADFSGMNGGREQLFLDRVIHKAFVELSEKGTEAAAATAATMVLRSAAPSTPPSIPVFRADHSFAFAIYDVHSGLVLFLGRVVAF